MKVFKEFISYKKIHLEKITLENKNGCKLSIINYGARVVQLSLCNQNIVLGYLDIKDYLKDNCYLGATLGPTSGRISGSKINLNKKIFYLSKNDNENNLHGGKNGFSFKFWKSKIKKKLDKIEITYKIRIKNLEDSYPGNRKIQVIYTLFEDNRLLIKYKGSSSKDTLMNMTNHMYFNLNNNFEKTVANHRIQLKGQLYYNNKNHIITNESKNIENLELSNSFNNYIKLDCNKLELSNIDNELKINIKSNYTGVVIYTADYPNYKTLLSNKKFSEKMAVALEFQNAPIGDNNLNLIQSKLNKNKCYEKYIEYEFRK
ncbi:MAG: hypothetical protein RR923_05510 [Bacilli bacterium]